MARIRILDAWLRYPAAAPTQQRAVMVVAEAWAEQRVLMRAYASSPDQTRPTIMLHGTQLAIGPAGMDPYGPWGIHVQPPADGRAQRLRQELEVAARRLAGSKGNPPRLVDEESAFERKRTNHWAPGTPPDLPAGSARLPYYEPSGPAPAGPGLPDAAAHAQASWPSAPATAPAGTPPARAPAAPGCSGSGWDAPVPRAAPNAPTVHLGGPGTGAHVAPVAPGRAATAVGLARGAGAQLGAGARLGGPRSAAASRTGARRLANLIRRTMPIGFQLTREEQTILDALDAAPSLTAARVAELVGTGDAVAWMQQLMAKLAGYGIDLIEAAPGAGGEPVYALRR